jgi:hypothetical protein
MAMLSFLYAWTVDSLEQKIRFLFLFHKSFFYSLPLLVLFLQQEDNAWLKWKYSVLLYILSFSLLCLVVYVLLHVSMY